MTLGPGEFAGTILDIPRYTATIPLRYIAGAVPHYRYASKDDCLLAQQRHRRAHHVPATDRAKEIPTSWQRFSTWPAGEGQMRCHLDQEAGNGSPRYPGLIIFPQRDYFDYTYLATDLANLPGKQCQQFPPAQPVLPRHANRRVSDNRANFEMLEFREAWCVWKDCNSEPSLQTKEAVVYALTHMASLGLQGIAIRVDGSIMAMAIYERLNQDTAVVHFEKALLECKGIYRAINAEAARILVNDYAYINRESDMGMPGLRDIKTNTIPRTWKRCTWSKREDLDKIV